MFLRIPATKKYTNQRAYRGYDQSRKQKYAKETFDIFPQPLLSAADQMLKIRKGYEECISSVKICILKQ